MVNPPQGGGSEQNKGMVTLQPPVDPVDVTSGTYAEAATLVGGIDFSRISSTPDVRLITRLHSQNGNTVYASPQLYDPAGDTTVTLTEVEVTTTNQSTTTLDSGWTAVSSPDLSKYYAADGLYVKADNSDTVVVPNRQEHVVFIDWTD